MEYTYTQDWFHWAPDIFSKLLPGLPARKRFLEIGSFEGRSAVWITENMLEDGGILSAVDTWTGGEEHEGGELEGDGGGAASHGGPSMRSSTTFGRRAGPKWTRVGCDSATQHRLQQATFQCSTYKSHSLTPPRTEVR